jgi:tetratricopeptide (TPR) repeat protein
MAKASDAPEPGRHTWYEIQGRYFEVLELFYEKGKRQKALAPALRLLRLLDKHDPNAEAMLGMSGRWLVAELDGDIEEAVRWREKEISLLRDHIATGLLETGALEADEFSDRLDLLALNYLHLKRYDDALAVLAESEAFCKKHNIPFDGKDIRADVKRAMRRKVKVAR